MTRFVGFQDTSYSRKGSWGIVEKAGPAATSLLDRYVVPTWPLDPRGLASASRSDYKSTDLSMYTTLWYDTWVVLDLNNQFQSSNQVQQYYFVQLRN